MVPLHQHNETPIIAAPDADREAQRRVSEHLKGKSTSGYTVWAMLSGGKPVQSFDGNGPRVMVRIATRDLAWAFDGPVRE